MGVEAAAKWLRSRPGDRRFASDDDVRHIADEMVRSLTDDPEGTEARTVTQIVRYLRECAFGDEKSKSLIRMADYIEAGDWKRQ